METPLQSEKVREKAHQLCREYLQVKNLSNHLILYLSTLQGSWKLVNAKQLEIRQISGGLSNLVFYVGLPLGQGRGGREANCILLRYVNN